MTKGKVIAGIVGGGLMYAVMFIGGWEGKSNKAYLDIVGVKTICYGHTEGVQIGDYATDEQCRAQLKEEVKVYWDRVDELVVAEMKPWEHIAFTSFSYNMGLGAFQSSTMRRYASGGNMAAACLELIKNSQWSNINCKTKGGCQFVPGLENRRQAEFRMCIGEGVQ